MSRTLPVLTVFVLGLFGCGDDSLDQTSDTAPQTTDPASQTTEVGGVSDAFCDAFDDYEAAQDGAQLNTALGTMTEELPSDAPTQVVEALDTLQQGDLDPEVTVDAAEDLSAWVDENCGNT